MTEVQRIDDRGQCSERFDAFPDRRWSGARRVAWLAVALAGVAVFAGCSSVKFVGGADGSGTGGGTLICTSSADCQEVVTATLNSFKLCDFVFNYSKIVVPGGYVVQWTIPSYLSGVVTFAPVSAGGIGAGIYIDQAGTDVNLRPFINPQSGVNDDKSQYFRWTANPDRTVTHVELPYYANVVILDALKVPVSCKSDPTIANN